METRVSEMEVTLKTLKRTALELETPRGGAAQTFMYVGITWRSC